MPRSLPLTLTVPPLVALLCASWARAGDPNHLHGHATQCAQCLPSPPGGTDARYDKHERPTPPPGKPRCIPHTHERAGYPLCLRNHLEPTNAADFCGHYTGGGGGGLRHLAGPRCVNDGTWGWDYVGVHFPRKVFLGFNHGRRYQGGTGMYITDGPCDPKDVVPGITGRLFPRRPLGEE